MVFLLAYNTLQITTNIMGIKGNDLNTMHTIESQLYTRTANAVRMAVSHKNHQKPRTSLGVEPLTAVFAIVVRLIGFAQQSGEPTLPRCYRGVTAVLPRCKLIPALSTAFGSQDQTHTVPVV